jgi:DNA polymerase elongation subunit (family B)
MNIFPNRIPTTFSRKKLIPSKLLSIPDKDRYFRVNDVENHVYQDNVFDVLTSEYVRHNIFELLLTGVNLAGEKVALVLSDIDIYVDILIPKMKKLANLTPQEKLDKTKIYHSRMLDLYKTNIKAYNRMAKQPYEVIVIKKMEIVSSRDMREYKKNNQTYLRVYFYNNDSRCKLIDRLHEHRMPTCSNEKAKSNYARIAGRLYDLKYGADIDTSNAMRYQHPYIKIDICFRIAISEVKYVTDTSKYADLFDRRRILVVGWDTEVQSKLGKEVKLQITDVNDWFKCINLSFFWLFEENPCMKISLCHRYVPSDKSIYTVTCNSQEEIMLSLGNIIGLMQPEFCVGFNDGEYDWPKMIHSLVSLRSLGGTPLIDQFFMAASCYVSKPIERISAYDRNKITMKQKYKLSADLTIESQLLTIPGCVTLDVRNLLRKFYRGADKSSLKFYLEKNNLPPKKDMSIARMFYIFEQGDKLEKIPVIQHLKSNIHNEEDNILHSLYKVRKHQYEEALRKGEIDIELLNGDIPLDWGNVKDTLINHLKSLTEKSEYREFALDVIDNIDIVFAYVDYLVGSNDVRSYCDTDAESCIRLWQRLFSYSECAAMASLANMPIKDCLWRADGMKVINFICKYANRAGFVLNSLHVEPKENAKYPGALVLHPKSNHYKLKPEKFKAANRKATEDILNIIEKYSAGEVSDDIDNDSAGPDITKDKLLIELGRLREYLSDEEKPIISQVMQTLLTIDDDTTMFNISEVLKSVLALNRLGFPIVALDFASLYPNIIRTYNLSPELIIRDKVKAEKYMTLGWKLYHISFKYGSRNVEAWTIISTPDGKRLHGIYGQILGDLFDLRNKVIKPELKKYPIEVMRKEGMNKTTHEKYAQYVEAEFMYKSIDARQKAIKIIMNTLYGKAGDTSSHIFMPEISGGTTEAGKYNLKLVNNFITQVLGSANDHKHDALKVMLEEKAPFEQIDNLIKDIIRSERNVDVIYGDTDSLYNSFKYGLYADDYQQFISGKITLLEYSARMVKLTMEAIEDLRKKVSTMLKEDNGANYLEMAYEEVLYPAVFLIKKKYMGVEHKENIVFDNYKKFEKGMLTGKIGFSDFSKSNINTISQQLLDINNELDPLEVVERQIDKVFNTKFSVSEFEQSAAWKPGKTGDGNGNVKVRTFIKRMRMEGMEDPLPYSRFKYVIVRKYPFKYDIKGRKKALSVGDKMEYPHVAVNQGYEIDIFHYVSKSLIAEMAAIVSVEPQFKVLPASNEEDDVKIAYEASITAAKKHLENYIKKFMLKYSTTQGNIFKYLYREIYKLHVKEVSMNINMVDVKDFNIAFNIDYISSPDVYEAWLKRMDKIAKERARRWVKTKKMQMIRWQFSTQIDKISQLAYRDEIKVLLSKAFNNLSYFESKYGVAASGFIANLNAYKDMYKDLYVKYARNVITKINNIRMDLNMESKEDIEIDIDTFYPELLRKIKGMRYEVNIEDEDKDVVEMILEYNNQIISNKTKLYVEQIFVSMCEEWLDSLVI